MGTPAYISPEQAEGSTATAASDVYSLAVVAFECLAGRKPFVADTPVAHRHRPPAQPGARPARHGARRPRGRRTPGDGQVARGALPPTVPAFARALRDPASVTGACAATAVAAAVARGRTTRRAGAAPAPAPAPTPARRPPSRRPPAVVRRRGRCSSASRPCWSPCCWSSGSAPATTSPRLDGRRHALAAPVAVAQRRTEPDTEPDAHRHADETPTETPTRDAERDARARRRRRRPPRPTGHGRGRPRGLRRARPQGRREELRDLGLSRSPWSWTNPGDQPDGIVDSVEPSGTLQEGDQVTVSFWGKTPPEPATSRRRERPGMTQPEPTLIGGRYELGELLGRGGMAEVRKGTRPRASAARSRSSGCAPTWRATRPSRPGSAARRSRRRRSTTPRSSSVYDTGEEMATDGSGVAQPYIVMECVEGRTLRDILREGRKILPERALEITSRRAVGPRLQPPRRDHPPRHQARQRDAHADAAT